MGAEWGAVCYRAGIKRSDEEFKQSEHAEKRRCTPARTMQRVLRVIDRLGALLHHTCLSDRLFSPENRFDCFFNDSHLARSDKNIHKPIPIPQQSHCLPLFWVVCSRPSYTRSEFLSLKNYFVNFTLGMERLGGDEHK